MSAPRPRLGAFLNGVPDVENLFPILSDLHKRDRIDLRLFVTTGLWLRDTRVRRQLKTSGVPIILRPNRLMKARFFYSRLLKTVDHMLVIGDPKLDTSAFGKRSRYFIEAGMPSIWVQHGVTQHLVAYSADDPASDYHSDPLFYWEDPARHTAQLAPGVTDRILVSGFTKRPYLPIMRPSQAFADMLSSYKKRVLICHTFRGGEHDADQVNWAYSMIRDYCRSNPDVAVIVRPHRGKTRANYNQNDKDLGAACPNVFFSLQYRGPMKGMNMLDVLQLVDCMISTASTAVLDALYQAKPAAVMASDSPQLSTLPEITDSASLANFVGGGMTDAMHRMVAHYGPIDDNIAYVCNEIEAKLLDTKGAA